MKNWFDNFIEFWSFKEANASFSGAILPTQEQLAEMPKLEELVASAAPVVWKQLDLTKLSKYPVYSQDGSSSCVAMSLCLIASILYYMRTNIAIMFSPAWVYQQRLNRPSAGMIGTDAFKIGSEGLLPEVLMPSQDLGETAINAVKTYPWYKTVAGAFAFEDRPVQLPVRDIETLASTMQVTGKPVNVWFSFNFNEWTSIPFVGSLIPTEKHSVVAIPNGYGIYEGEKAIVIQDSWGPGATQFGALRIIKKSFFEKRNMFTAYPRRFQFETSEDKPKYDGTIISFQRCMKSLGLFPENVEFVENWGVMTTQACIKFQAKYGIKQTGQLGPTTKAKVYELFP